jgi:insertion element IS1 protein InsB
VLIAVNEPLLNTVTPSNVEVVIRRADDAEVDEMWSFVGRKTAQRWLWHAIDHHTGKVLAYVFGRRQDTVFLKRNTQQIERKHLTLRTRIKRLTRKTICFSKSTQMHDIVIGLFVNRYEFGLPVLWSRKNGHAVKQREQIAHTHGD